MPCPRLCSPVILAQEAGKHPLDDLMLHPNVNGLHPFLPSHLNRKGTESEL